MAANDMITNSNTITAVFGSPKIDGIIDECWEKAEVTVPKLYGAASDVTAEHRVMWDDNALYILSVIKDRNLDCSNVTSHQQDSLEIFLDEHNDRGAAYQPDDLHYRVNYKNERTHDAGDKTRFYSKTQITKDAGGSDNGYIVEACIVWDKSVTPVNGMEMGFELMINDAQNGRRVTSISVFDSTGSAFQNPSVFGKIVLAGKQEGARTGTNPYVLLSYIDSVKSIYLDAYVNKESIAAPLAAAEKIAAEASSTQEKINRAFADLKAAVDGLNDGSGFTKPSALPLVTELPDAFTFLDGKRVAGLKEWELRKYEIAMLFQYYMYGAVPDQSAETITTEYVDSYTMKNWWGKDMTITSQPDRKLVKINVSKDHKTVNFIASVTFPSVTKTDPGTGENIITQIPSDKPDGYPVLIMIGFLGEKEKRYLNDHGYAVIEFNNTVVAADNASHTGVFYELYPYGKKWTEQSGVLLAWTWGVSRIIDVLEMDAAGAKELNISPVNTIVSGVSRNGKSAAVAGAYDSRIKVTVPASSGEGGMACFRYFSAGKQYDYSMLELHELTDQLGDAEGTAAWQKCQDSPIHTVGTNEALSNIQSAGHWFNDNFQGFSSPYQLPFDQHLLAALCAGKDRYYLITGEIIGGDWINPAAMYATYLAAQNIYDTLGLGDHIGVHLHAVGHALTLEDTKYLVEFCNKNFYGLIDGNKDLSQLKTSIYEDSRNYDGSLDLIKTKKNLI